MFIWKMVQFHQNYHCEGSTKQRRRNCCVSQLHLCQSQVFLLPAPSSLTIKLVPNHDIFVASCVCNNSSSWCHDCPAVCATPTLGNTRMIIDWSWWHSQPSERESRCEELDDHCLDFDQHGGIFFTWIENLKNLILKIWTRYTTPQLGSYQRVADLKKTWWGFRIML